MTSRRLVFASLVMVGSFACGGGDPGDNSGSSDSGGATETTTSTTAMTTTSSTVGSESEATTASPTSTSTSTTEPGTTEAPTSTSTTTTGDPFFCPVDMDGCCEVAIEVEADTFFSDAIGGIVEGCPLVDFAPPEFTALRCEHFSFGAIAELQVFNDDGGISAPVVGRSVMALKFPSADGTLLLAGEPVPNEWIQAAHLELSAEVDWTLFDDLRFSVHGLGADAIWQESQDEAATGCVDGLASFACLGCGKTVGGECESPWTEPPGTSPPLAIVDGLPDQDAGLLPIDLAPLGAASEWVPEIAGGVVVVPSSSTFMDQAFVEHVPYPGLRLHARESGTAPRLRLRLCQP
ncbi:hypothetical protein SAMN02745121_03970 [Nannocystis exedens]|uniref:Uncharacterized protein n=1 Tax=Nannocystis exedens TaxID=54 RepID=A0A1I1ZY00_9BACT|nr:hypothetical protein [Nannocystis exedens]PCC75307.1 hypothetical protein NAEX_08416 [Nannocystis exedens]SFE35330.1 hypothetical protein SAMN02745121_03970 [Nannocystis exedens]